MARTMTMPQDELKRVVQQVGRLYDEMVRVIWGDRVTLALTAAALGGFGLGLVLHDSRGARITGAICYASAGMMELYAAMTPKTREQREATEARPEARPEPRAA